MSVLSAPNVSWADLAWSSLSNHFAGLLNHIWIRVRQWNPTIYSVKYSGASSIFWHNSIFPFRIQAQWEPPLVQTYWHATAHQRSSGRACVLLWHVNEELFSPLQSTNKKQTGFFLWNRSVSSRVRKLEKRTEFWCVVQHHCVMDYSDSNLKCRCGTSLSFCMLTQKVQMERSSEDSCRMQNRGGMDRWRLRWKLLFIFQILPFGLVLPYQILTCSIALTHVVIVA